VEVKEKYQVKISNRFADLENLGYDVDMNWAWESIREYESFSHRHSMLLFVETA
jgi:hypothetical protein